MSRMKSVWFGIAAVVLAVFVFCICLKYKMWRSVISLIGLSALVIYCFISGAKKK